MNYEQKYKQALSRATFYNNELLTENQRKMLLDIFPELTMSEDEKMKDYIKDVIQAAIIPKKENKQKMIAWLEKQGKQQGKSALEAIKEEKVDNQNCIKSADKIKPKFHEGEWITDGYVGGQITSIDDNYPCYKIADFMGGINTSIPFSLQDNYHLWNISDAKDGDVLLEEETGEPFIYNGNRAIYFSGYFLGAYCGIYNGVFNPLGNNHHWGKNSCPATKEQRDQLEKAITEAGYRWDSEKKELKTIEPKTLNPDKVIEWLECMAFQGWAEEINIKQIVNKFKKDFRL